MRHASAMLPCALAIVLPACTNSPPEQTPARLSTVTIETSEYAFSAPQAFRGGLLEVTLDNSSGQEAHAAQMLRLDPGKSLADVEAAIMQELPTPDWAHAAGGHGPVPAGGTAVYTGNFEEGIYVLLCQVPAPDGEPHIAKGMAAQITIEPADSGHIPEGDATITLTDNAFGGVQEIVAGPRTIQVSNAGEAEHDVVIFAMGPGKELADALTFWGGRAESSPSPFEGVVGLVASIAPGTAAARTLTLEAGTTYVFACFTSDIDDHTPHVFKGMAEQLRL